MKKNQHDGVFGDSQGENVDKLIFLCTYVIFV